MSASILNRSIFSIASNVSKAVLSLVTASLIARGLGPEDFGTFSFLITSFIALRSLLDLGSSSAFFSFISKKTQPKIFFTSYAAWLGLQFAVSILFIFIIAPENWIEKIWDGENREIVSLAFIAAFMQQQIWGMVSNIGESQRFTYKVQLLNLIIAIFHLIFIIILFSIDKLFIETIFLIIIFEIGMASLIAWKIFSIEFSNQNTSIKKIINDYKIYCLPLIPYTILSFIMGFGDNWLLQNFGGSIQQAYYSIGSRFAAISLIATTSVLKVLWKEVSEANELGNDKKLFKIYITTNSILFALGAMISGYLIPWSSEIIILLLGKEYLDGALILSVMFLYPIHQSLGQINGTMYLAIEKTKIYAKIGSIWLILSTVCSYFLLASKDSIIPGLGMAGLGLSLKMLIMQFIQVNFYMYVLSKIKSWSFNITYQFVGIFSFTFFGFCAKYLSVDLINFNIWISFIVSLMIFLAMSLILFYSFPGLLNSNRQEINYYLRKIRILN